MCLLQELYIYIYNSTCIPNLGPVVGSLISLLQGVRGLHTPMHCLAPFRAELYANVYGAICLIADWLTCN